MRDRLRRLDGHWTRGPSGGDLDAARTVERISKRTPLPFDDDEAKT
jgi:hypothetical protein